MCIADDTKGFRIIPAHHAHPFYAVISAKMKHFIISIIAIRLKIQTRSGHKIHRSELLRPDLVNLNSWIAIKKPSRTSGGLFDIFRSVCQGTLLNSNIESVLEHVSLYPFAVDLSQYHQSVSAVGNLRRSPCVNACI